VTCCFHGDRFLYCLKFIYDMVNLLMYLRYSGTIMIFSRPIVDLP